MHHREVHRVGDERAWWKAAGVDPLKVAHTPCMTGEPDSPMLTNLGAAAGVTGELFHTPMGAAFADLTINGQRQTWAIRSKTFRAWLRRSHYEATGTALSGASIRSTLDLLEARALFDSPERAVHVRGAEHAGHIYLDLGDQRAGER